MEGCIEKITNSVFWANSAQCILLSTQSDFSKQILDNFTTENIKIFLVKVANPCKSNDLLLFQSLCYSSIKISAPGKVFV